MSMFVLAVLAVILIVLLANVLGANGQPAPAAPACGPAPRPPVIPTPIPVVRRDSRPERRPTVLSCRLPRTGQAGRGRGSDGYPLDASKTVAAFDFILRSLARQPAWATPQLRENYEYDLAVMLKHGDLQTASLELLAADRTVLYRHRVQFQQVSGPARQGCRQGHRKCPCCRREGLPNTA